MQQFPNNFTLKDKVEFLQRKVILNSIIYYYLDNNLMSDLEYDILSRHLVELQNIYGDVSDTQYGYVMKDFDGNTGFDLYERLNDSDKQYLRNLAEHMVRG